MMIKSIKMVLVFLLLGTLSAWSVEISTWHPSYKKNQNVWIKLENKPGNEKDWIGIYKAGSNSDWENAVKWVWAKDDSKKYPNWYTFTGLKDGQYEARFFLNNTYKVEKKVGFTVGDVTVKITTWHPRYKTNQNVWIKLENKPGNAEDWIGIYKVGSSNDWSNAVKWVWAKDDSKKYPNWYEFSGLKDGQYEARFFLNNTFKVEKKVGFTVGDVTVKITTWHPSYKTNENVWIKLENKPGNVEDWIGIYKAGSNNDWDNVVKWVWAKDDSKKYPNWYTFTGLKAGQYEARFFLNNTFTLETKVAFAVSGENSTNYEDYGTYSVSNLTKLNEGKIYIYKPKKDGVVRTKAPVIVYLKGGWADQGSSNLDNSKEFMKFMVSKGYVVIGVHTAFGSENEFQRIMSALNQLGNVVDKSKIGLMGSSTGGGRVFYHLRRLKEEGMADTSFLISLDGYTALNEKISDVRRLNTTTLLLQFGGSDGLDYQGQDNGNTNGIMTRYQDPRILMALYNVLPGNDKSLSYLNNHTHGYASGSMNGKQDMLRVVGAMLSYKFENGGQTARNVALDNNKYEEIDNNKIDENKYRFKCNEYGYDYCDVFNPTQDF